MPSRYLLNGESHASVIAECFSYWILATGRYRLTVQTYETRPKRWTSNEGCNGASPIRQRYYSENAPPDDVQIPHPADNVAKEKQERELDCIQGRPCEHCGRILISLVQNELLQEVCRRCLYACFYINLREHIGGEDVGQRRADGQGKDSHQQESIINEEAAELR